MKNMPLIDEEPPITRPRGTPSTRPFRCGSGSLRYPQVIAGSRNARSRPSGSSDQEAIVAAAGLDQQHANLGIRAQSIREHAAGRAGADDDVVVAHNPTVTDFTSV